MVDQADEGPAPIYYCDRSGAETDDTCGMAFWWNRKEAGAGIVPKEEVVYRRDGIATHEDLAAIGELEDISPASVQAYLAQLVPSNWESMVNDAKERLWRRLGWAAAWALFMEPNIRKEYENVSIESEILLDRSPLWVAVTPDRVLRHREKGYLVYKEYKTTRFAGPAWTTHWPYDIQIHIGLAAIEEELEEHVAFGQVVGLIKGEQRGGRLAHPYVWGYRNLKTGSWTHDYNLARSGDWDNAPVWEYPGGIVEWVSKLGPEIAKAQFPHSAPCFLDKRMLSDWTLRRMVREQQISEIEDECRLDWESRIIYFEPRTRSCRPAYGDACPYLAACWNAGIRENPIASGIYTARTPHHEIERVMRGEIK